jgi:hypothetical protein
VEPGGLQIKTVISFLFFFLFSFFWANLTVKKLKRNRLKERAKDWTCRALKAVTTAFLFSFMHT